MSATKSASEVSDLEDASDGELSRDDIFHVLQCRRRRLVLKYLQEYDEGGPATMSDIAEHIAAFEYDTTVAALRSQERQRVYIALYQSHLPKMDKAGVIEYEQDRGLIETTDLTASFDPYLVNEPSLLSQETEEQSTAAPEDDLQEIESEPTTATAWHRRYLYTSGGTLSILAGAYLGLWSGLLQFGAEFAVLVSAAFALLAVGHTLSESRATEDSTSPGDRRD